jgi:hypothetical protein
MMAHFLHYPFLYYSTVYRVRNRFPSEGAPMKSPLMSDTLVTGLRNNPHVRWSPEPVEPSLKRGVFYGLLLSFPFWGLLLKILL